MTTLTEHIQSPEIGAVITLFDLDASALGGDVLHFTTSAYDTSAIQWRGNTYSPMPVEADGWEWGGDSLPTPKLRVANVNSVIGAMVIAYGDLLGATVTRWKTFDRFLDGQPDADPDFYIQKDVYRIERKSSHNRRAIEWELAAAMDHAGRKIPGRQVLRTCGWRYRRWDATTESFVYPPINSCSYTGDVYLTAGGITTTSDKDACGKHLSDCVARFGTTAELPFGGFPGVSSVEV